MLTRTERFSQNLEVPGLAYTTVTTTYKNGLLHNMYAQGHLDTGSQWVKMLWDPIHIVFKEPKLLENDHELITKELQKALWLPITTKEQKSLPSS